MWTGPAGRWRCQRPPSALDTLPHLSQVDRQAQTAVLRPWGQEDGELNSRSPLTDTGLWLSWWPPAHSHQCTKVEGRPGPGTLGSTTKCPLMGGAPTSLRSRWNLWGTGSQRKKHICFRFFSENDYSDNTTHCEILKDKNQKRIVKMQKPLSIPPSSVNCRY